MGTQRKSGTRATAGFTLIEVLVVVAIIALLCSLLMPSLVRARREARHVACRASLSQWGVIWGMYLQTNKESFSDNPHRVPVLADMMWRGGGPSESGTGGDPPGYNGQWSGYDREMMHFCIDRHDGHVNHLFADWSVRKVGLKELWKLKWHRTFNTAGRWTRAGGATSKGWPAWMRRFRDY